MKLKSNRFILFWMTVLLFGLFGCSPDKPKNYEIREPNRPSWQIGTVQINKHGSKTHNLLLFEESVSYNYELFDQFKFTDLNGAKTITVESRCNSKNIVYNAHQFKITAQENLFYYELLSKEVLLDLMLDPNEVITCQSRLTFANANGDTHAFSLNRSLLKNQEPIHASQNNQHITPGFKIQKMDSNGKRALATTQNGIYRINKIDLDSYIIAKEKTRDHKNDELHFLCDSARASLIFNQSDVTLDELELNLTHSNTSHVMSNNAQKRCILFQTTENKVTWFSNLFEIYSAPSQIEITIQGDSSPSPLTSAPFVQLIEIKNITTKKMKLAIPNDQYAKMTYINRYNGQNFAYEINRKLHVEIINTKYKRTAKHVQFELDGRSAAQILLTVTPDVVKCSNGEILGTFIEFRNAAGFIITELTPLVDKNTPSNSIPTELEYSLVDSVKRYNYNSMHPAYRDRAPNEVNPPSKFVLRKDKNYCSRVKK